jgi:hypothetical protein
VFHCPALPYVVGRLGPAAGPFPLQSESYPTAAGFVLETVELVTGSRWCERPYIPFWVMPYIG